MKTADTSISAGLLLDVLLAVEQPAIKNIALAK